MAYNRLADGSIKYIPNNKNYETKKISGGVMNGISLSPSDVESLGLRFKKGESIKNLIKQFKISYYYFNKLRCMFEWIRND